MKRLGLIDIDNDIKQYWSMKRLSHVEFLDIHSIEVWNAWVR